MLTRASLLSFFSCCWYASIGCCYAGVLGLTRIPPPCPLPASAVCYTNSLVLQSRPLLCPWYLHHNCHKQPLRQLLQNWARSAAATPVTSCSWYRYAHKPSACCWFMSYTLYNCWKLCLIITNK